MKGQLLGLRDLRRWLDRRGHLQRRLLGRRHFVGSDCFGGLFRGSRGEGLGGSRDLQGRSAKRGQLFGGSNAVLGRAQPHEDHVLGHGLGFGLYAHRAFDAGQHELELAQLPDREVIGVQQKGAVGRESLEHFVEGRGVDEDAILDPDGQGRCNLSGRLYAYSGAKPSPTSEAAKLRPAATSDPLPVGSGPATKVSTHLSSNHSILERRRFRNAGRCLRSQA